MQMVWQTGKIRMPCTLPWINNESDAIKEYENQNLMIPLSQRWSILKSNEWTIIIYFSYLIRIPLLFHLPSFNLSHSLYLLALPRLSFANRERWYCHCRWYSYTSNNHYALRIEHKENRHLLHSICLMTSNIIIAVMHSYTQLHLDHVIKKIATLLDLLKLSFQFRK